MKKLLVLLLALLLIGTTALATELEPVEIGQEASDFSAELLDGTTFQLSAQRGKVVIVNLWATWCPSCVEEMPDLQRVSQEFADSVSVLGISLGEDAATVRTFLDENGITYPVALDQDYALSMKMFPCDYIPYTIVIDPNGVVTKLHVGGGDDMYAVFSEYIADALANAQSADAAV